MSEEEIKKFKELLKEEINRVIKINDLSSTYVPIYILETLLNYIEQLENKVKELEEMVMEKDLEIMGKETYIKEEMKEIIEHYYTANEDCIPKQEIQDKIDEYEELLKDFEQTDNTGRFKREKSRDFDKKIALEELLKGE